MKAKPSSFTLQTNVTYAKKVRTAFPSTLAILHAKCAVLQRRYDDALHHFMATTTITIVTFTRGILLQDLRALPFLRSAYTGGPCLRMWAPGATVKLCGADF